MRKPLPYLKFVLVLIAAATVVSSCSKRLQNNTANSNESKKDSVNVNAAAEVEARSVAIDTVNNRVSDQVRIAYADPYFSSRVSFKTNEFYSRGAQTKWMYDNAPSSIYDHLLDLFRNASQFGLNPSDYDIENIEQRVAALYNSKRTPDTIAELDIHISEMFFLYTTHLSEGRVRTVANGKNIWKRDLTVSPSTADVMLLTAVENAEQLSGLVSAIQPATEQYRKLQDALTYYRNLVAIAPEVPPIAVKTAVKPGELNPAVPLIRKKLSLTDQTVYRAPLDSMTGLLDSLRYDPSLVAAVKLFQLRHGLTPDGIIGEKSLRFMNQTFPEKANTIALNMDRLRWVSPNYSDNYIVVNVPEYKMRVYDHQRQEFEMKVIVGAPSRPTPIFSEQLEHIVFSPTWTVPTSIIREEIIPHLKQDSLYYRDKNFLFLKNGMEIDPALENWHDEKINPYQFRVVQNPGTDNSLGSVKFMMPNNLSVYLHDTPNHRLFSKDYRALSHGCVRLNEPAKFAEYLLRDQRGWSAERITKAMNDSTPSTILLKKYYQVNIEYCTAWVDEQGLVNFREDIYGHDKAQLRHLRPAITQPAAAISAAREM
ncbi:MAG: L,D-transpeptidase family protein [Chryseolinea sp.]